MAPPALKPAVIRYRHFLLGLLHSALIIMAFTGSFVVRFDFSVPEPYRTAMLRALPLALSSKLVVFYFFNLFQGWWEYVGVRDLIDIAKASIVSSLTLLITLVLVGTFAEIPRSIFLLDLALTFLLIGGVRFAVRAYTETVRTSSDNSPARRVLIIGAGATGNHLVREMRSSRRLNYHPVGFVDDDPAKHRSRIQGLAVFGPTELIPALVEQYRVDEVLLALPTATGKQRRRILELCQRAGVPSKTIPTFTDLIDGLVSVSRLRDVRIEDLLGREPVAPNVEQIRRNIKGQRLLVTGAAGSIGAELARQIAAHDPAQLVVLDRSESDLHDLELALRRAFPAVAITAVIGDILDPQEMNDICAMYRPTRVYHAAAYKHVGLMEHHVVAVVRHNILGTRNVASAAAAHGAEQFVLISSDKAVRPTSLMGATKRAAERVVLGMSGSRTRFSAVRFGNVLGSRGSVVPLFREQIANGGPVTVTHPEIVRYFMTIPEAVELVLQASSMSNRQEIYHLDMGDPVRIVDLAENMIRLSGLEPGKDIEIVFTGLKPGEKLYEELLIAGEGVVSTAHPRIRVAQQVDRGVGQEWLQAVAQCAASRNAGALLRHVMAAVPEYTPSELVQKIAAEVPVESSSSRSA